MLSNKWVPQAKQPTEQGSTEGKKKNINKAGIKRKRNGRKYELQNNRIKSERVLLTLISNIAKLT